MRYLTEKGIKYTFVRKTRDFGISQFKYKKTPELFQALAEFYAQIEKEKAERPVTEEELKRAQEIIARAEKFNVKDDTE